MAAGWSTGWPAGGAAGGRRWAAAASRLRNPRCIARLSGPWGAYVDVPSIAKFSAAPDPAAYYLEVIANERDDYYLASGEAPGQWIGAGTERLGLKGEVEAEGRSAP